MFLSGACCPRRPYLRCHRRSSIAPGAYACSKLVSTVRLSPVLQSPSRLAETGIPSTQRPTVSPISVLLLFVWRGHSFQAPRGRKHHIYTCDGDLIGVSILPDAKLVQQVETR